MNYNLFRKMLIPAVLVLGISMLTGSLHAACEYQQDAPDCECFDNSGAWGGFYPPGSIQEVALRTVDTRTSCIEEVGEPHAGKPYYQMVLGMNTERGALNASYLLTKMTNPPFDRRQAWCSETIAYWHREAGIPYERGYRNDWNENWQRYNVLELSSWYQTEQEQGGRGRWIRSDQVDYESAELGRTLPTPGAYMAWTRYLPYGGENGSGIWGNVNRFGHSLMIDELWIHRDAYGDVFRVEATFLEGNSLSRVRNTRPRADDLLSLTVQGSQWFSYNNGEDDLPGTADDYGNKIYGFGIDLDQYGNPVYDASRLHYVEHPYMRRALHVWPLPLRDPDWDRLYRPIWKELQAYAAALIKNRGPSIYSNIQGVKLTAIPDGHEHSWTFPNSLRKQEVTIVLDFLNPHPLLIDGLTLHWDSIHIPVGYRVQFGDRERNYTDARLSDLPSAPLTSLIARPAAKDIPPTIVAARLDKPQSHIRYVRFIFPENTFKQTAALVDLTITQHYGDGDDIDDVTETMPLFVDILPGECPNLIADDASVLTITILGSAKRHASAIDPQSITLNGKAVVPRVYYYQDMATPYIGTAPGCHRTGPDGEADLILEYDRGPLFEALGLNQWQGGDFPVTVAGKLTVKYNSLPFLGQDFIRLPSALPHLTARILDWAEHRWPELFPEAGREIHTGQNLYYRYYPGTGIFLGGHQWRLLYYQPAISDILYNLGHLDNWLIQAAQDGF